MPHDVKPILNLLIDHGTCFYGASKITVENMIGLGHFQVVERKFLWVRFDVFEVEIETQDWRELENE